MKKIFMFLILGIFLISLASAGVSYEEENLTYNIDSIWPTWLGGNGESVVKLINNTDECLIECSFTLEFQNQKPLSLLEDINFINRKGETVEYSLLDLNFKVGRYENITTSTPIYETNCEDIFNETTNNVTQSCTQIQTGEDTNTEEVLTWNNYNGEELDGLSYLKLDAKKDPTKSMDWVITFRGEDLINWAWWNTSWGFKREVTITENSGSSLSNYSTLIYVEYDSDMNTDFSDLRFLNSVEDTELGYWIENKTDSSHAYVWVKVPSLTASSNTSIYMYYGNSGASSNSNADNTFWVYFTSATEYSTYNSIQIINSETIYLSGEWEYKIQAHSVYSNQGSYSQYVMAGFDNSALDSSDDLLRMGNLDCSGGINWQAGTPCRYSGITSYQAKEYNFIRPPSYETTLGTTHTFYFGHKSDNAAKNSKLKDITIILKGYASSEPTYTIGAEEESTGINIEYVTPPTPVNYANITDLEFTVEVNVTLNEVNFTNITYYMQNANGTEYIDTFTNETYSLNYSLPTGHFHYNVTTCGDSDTLGTFCDSTETRYINHDITPPEINLTAPSGTFDYLIDNYTLDLNWTVTDEGSNESVDYLDSCWYEYNGTNNSLTCYDNHTTFNYIAEINNLTFWANDTFGNYQSNTTIWDYKVLEVNQTYNEETTEGSLETFLAHIKLGSGLSIEDAVLFNYNGTETTGQAFESGIYEVLRKTNMLVPSVSTDTNFTFYWGITLSDNTEVNLSSQNQTVYNLAVDNCSSYTNTLFNFTVLDEEEQTIIPSVTIETALNFYDSTRDNLVFNYSNQFEGVNPLAICLNRNITNETSYSVDVIVRYESSEHANEYYNIVNSTIDIDTTGQDITLYDLNLSDSTEFQLTFTGADFLPVENALIYVDRQYIQEDTFKTVELPKTDYNGQTILHLVRNDVIYNIRILKDGEVLGNFENIVAFCQDFTIGDCKIELNAFDSVEAIYNYDDSLGIIFTEPTYNETSDKITFNFVTEDGSAKTVKLEVTRNDIFGNRSICNSTLTSSGGTLTCNIDPNLDDSTLKTEIYVDNVLAVSGNVKLDTSNYGVGGYLILFVMAISFILMFSGSKTGVLVSMGVTFIAAISLGLVTGDIIGIGASGLWLIIIIIIGIIKLNNERAQ